MGTHRSASTTIQTYVSIRELNGNISADTYPEDASQSLPYFNSYVDLLKDIKEGNVTYKDVQGQTPEQEYYQNILLEGILVKREHRQAKKNIISPELSLHRLSKHAQKELVGIVCTFPI